MAEIATDAEADLESWYDSLEERVAVLETKCSMLFNKLERQEHLSVIPTDDLCALQAELRQFRSLSKQSSDELVRLQEAEARRKKAALAKRRATLREKNGHP